MLWIISHYPDVKVYIADKAPRHCREILDRLAQRQIIRGYATIKAESVIESEDYVFTQAEAYSGFVQSTDLFLLTKNMLGEARDVAKENRSIYISRKHSARSFDNESDVKELLQNCGFRSIQCENLALSQQIALFQAANMVVASHGAGLANLVWCQPGTRVIEIFSPKYFNDCYARLGSSLRLDYQAVWALESNAWGRVDLARLQEIIANG